MNVHNARCWRQYASEAVGTFALVAVGPGAAMVAASTQAFGHTGVALAFGLVIAFVVAATGHLGGALINPAVTLAFWSVRRVPGREVGPYIAAQCLGATAASFALRWFPSLRGDRRGNGKLVEKTGTQRVVLPSVAQIRRLQSSI